MPPTPTPKPPAGPAQGKPAARPAAAEDQKAAEMARLAQAIGRHTGIPQPAAGLPRGKAVPPGGIAGAVPFPPGLRPGDASAAQAAEDYPESVAAHLASLAAGTYQGLYDSGPYESAEAELASARAAAPRTAPELVPHLSAARLSRPRLSGGVAYRPGDWLVVGPAGEVYCVTADEYAARYDRAASGEERAAARARLARQARAEAAREAKAAPPAADGLDEGAGI